jgi:hypothetical protein
MKNVKTNWYLRIGMLIIAFMLSSKYFIQMPYVLQGLGLGVGISLEMIGIFSINNDMTKLKSFKRKLLKRKVLYSDKF